MDSFFTSVFDLDPHLLKQGHPYYMQRYFKYCTNFQHTSELTLGSTPELTLGRSPELTLGRCRELTLGRSPEFRQSKLRRTA